MAKVFCQLAEQYDGSPLPYPMWVECKLDGLRAISVVADGKVRFYSRLGNAFHNTEHVAQSVLALTPPPQDAIYDGELVAADWNETNSICHLEGTHPRADTLTYVVFDVLKLIGRSLLTYSQRDRRSYLEALSWDRAKHATLVAGQVVETSEKVIDLAKQFLVMGFEGAMLKDLSAVYKGTRTRAWRKVKFTETVDATITNAIEGKGKFVGTLGAVVFDYNGIEGKAGTGMNDAERARLWKMHSEGRLVGKTVEVKYTKQAKSVGRFRSQGKMFPVYVRLREDK